MSDGEFKGRSVVKKLLTVQAKQGVTTEKERKRGNGDG